MTSYQQNTNQYQNFRENWHAICIIVSTVTILKIVDHFEEEVIFSEKKN